MKPAAPLFALSLAACGPAVSTTTDGASGTTSGPSATAGSSAQTSATAVSGMSTGGSSSGTSLRDSTTGAAESSTSTGEFDHCADIPAVASGRLSIDREVPTEDTIDLDEVCIVTDVMVEDEQQDVRVGCRSNVFVLTLQDVVPLPLSPGEELRVQAQRNFPIDYGGYEHVALRRTSGELLAATHSTRAPPGFDATAFFSPFSASLVHGVCPILPYEDDDTSSFIVDPCAGDTERLAFDASDGTRTVQVLSGQVAPLGDYEFHARFAMQLDPDDPALCPLPSPHTIDDWGVFPSR